MIVTCEMCEETTDMVVGIDRLHDHCEPMRFYKMDEVFVCELCREDIEDENSR